MAKPFSGHYFVDLVVYSGACHVARDVASNLTRHAILCDEDKKHLRFSCALFSDV